MKTWKPIAIATAALLLPFGDAEEDYIFHIMQPGDTPPSVAERFLGSKNAVYEILQVNGISNVSEIKVGTKLAIPHGIRKRAIDKFNGAGEDLAKAKVAGADDHAPTEFQEAKGFYQEALVRLDAADYGKSTFWSGKASVKAGEAHDIARKLGVKRLQLILSRKFGTVERSADGGKRWIVMRQGDAADQADWVRTAEGATAQLLLPDKSVIDIASDTTLQIEDMKMDLVERAQRTALKIIQGEILGRIQKKGANDSFDIMTPSMNVIIRGTTVRVSADAEASRLAVLEGDTRVKVGDKTINVGGNEGLLVKNEQASKFALLPAPVVAARFDALRTPERRVQLSWTRPAESHGVFFELARDEEFSEIEAARNVKDAAVRTGLLKPGVYYWRVTGLSEEGLKGNPSAAQKLEITTDLEFRIEPKEPLVDLGGRKLSGADNTFRAVPVRKVNSIIGYEYSWDGNEFSPMTGPVARPVHGEHTLAVRAVTEDGTLGSPETFKFEIDAQAPTLVVEQDRSLEAAQSLLRLTFTGDDDAGIDRLEIRQDKGAFKPYADKAVVTVSTLVDTVVEARAIDHVGNSSAIKRVSIQGRAVRN